MSALGDFIRAERREKGWTLRDLADRTGRHFTSLSKIERGHEEPGRDLLAKLAALFDMDAEMLYRAAERRCPTCGALRPKDAPTGAEGGKQ